MTGDLIAFLSARLDEDEAAVKAATPGPWAWEATGDKDNSWAVGLVQDDDEQPLSGQIEHGQGVVIDGVCESINGHVPDADHIARHDPARSLREVEADRAILDRLDRAARYRDQVFAQEPPRSGSDEMRAVTTMLTLESVVKLRAAIYSDHPDYRPEWAA